MKSVSGDRPEVLSGTTYKIKPERMDHSIYVTVNDTADKKPYEVFIRCDDMTLHPWLTFIGTLISAIFQKTDDPYLVPDQMAQIFDPRGGYNVENGIAEHVSIVAHIGKIIKLHLDKRGE